MAVTVSYSQWEQALTSIGWADPYPAHLWGRLGGADSVVIDRGSLVSLASSLGWSEAHAERLWSAVSGQGPMPWERPAPQQAPQRAPQQAPQQAPSKKPKRPAPDAGLALRRLAASLIDGTVFAAALIAVCGLGKISVAVAVGQQSPSGLWPQLILVMLTVTALMMLYFSWSMRRPASPGQSLGKQLLSLRVVCVDGSPVSARQVLLREGLGAVLIPWVICWGVNLLLWPGGLLVAALFLAFACLGRGLTDRIAATKVIAS